MLGSGAVRKYMSGSGGFITVVVSVIGGRRSGIIFIRRTTGTKQGLANGTWN